LYNVESCWLYLKEVKRVVLLTEEPPPVPTWRESRESTERERERERAGCSDGRQNFLQLSGTNY